MQWDTIVIGSGPGGLTAAVALARAGQKVLVLEQHYLPGGWTHSFNLGGVRFSPGVHYVGDLQPGGGLRRLYESFGMSDDLEFCELNPDGFDHFLVAGERFDQPRGRDRWTARLKARFPHEARAIDRYFDTLAGVTHDISRCDESLAFPAVLTIPFRFPRLLRWGFRPLSALLDSTIRDPMLRGVLAAQCGNHGLPPSQVSLPLHASMTAHYFDGGFYPRGGAKRIPAAYIRALRRLGGAIRLHTPVTKILVENERAVGVEIAGGETIRAGHVVCNADPAVTFGRLLAAEHCPSELKKVRHTTYSVGMLSVFAAVRDLDLRGMGYDSGNYWFYRHARVGEIYERALVETPREAVDGLFLTITSLKDPGHTEPGTHAIEMFTFVPYDAFGQWSDPEGTPGPNPKEDEHPARGADYDALKRAIGEKMLAAADEVIPGLRSHLSFVSIGTPLTNDYYCRSYRGAIYGTAKTPLQVGPFSFATKGPVDGLYFAGSSILSHGVAGASMSGLMAARELLGLRGIGEIVGPGDGSLRIVPAEGAAARGDVARAA